MEFKFKKQQYQKDAVNNTADVFAGQPFNNNYRQNGSVSFAHGQAELFESMGSGNAPINLGYDNQARTLDNIRAIQQRSSIPLASKLCVEPGQGLCALDIEMETGTGKTYVYINTIFELNKRYGWSKFVVVVPSIAIREGALKSFAMLEHHFFDEYGKKAHYFVYDSKRLADIKHFSASDNIEVMIINTQAFNSLDESKVAARRIFTPCDEFNSYRPIDAIAKMNPIVIIDEPQKAAGNATQKALKQFNPLFVLNYSATHKNKHNCIYALDAVDAFEQKLVKRISVKGLELKNIKGSNCYLYLDDILLSSQAPQARLELEVKSASGALKRKLKVLDVGDSLFIASAEFNGYQDLFLSEIDPVHNAITLSDGTVLHKGEILGDDTTDTLQRLQIRETISSHLNKEEALFKRQIKTLSLFFIDEVANYKSYDEQGQEQAGKFAQWFEEEYRALVEQRLKEIESHYANSHSDDINQDGYYQYLLKTKDTISKIHNGYFSIDKHKHLTNSKANKDGLSDDIAAYDLILRNKERLLSFEEPTRFIFSHSALREGWDNPNVFQICTLRHSTSEINKRQEIGRGMRLCVNDQGERMDTQVLGNSIHEVNTLTVIANESYENFVSALQKETEQVLRERPKLINAQLFARRTIKLDDDTEAKIGEQDAALIYSYFISNEYIDAQGYITDKYKHHAAQGKLASPVDKIKPFEHFMHAMARSTYSVDSSYSNMIVNELKAANLSNELNDNFYKEQFQKLWRSIHHKYYYTVDYDSQELIEHAIQALNEHLQVDSLIVKIKTGIQTNSTEFGEISTRSEVNPNSAPLSAVKYDLVGEIAKHAKITRGSSARILRKISKEKFALFAQNPEQFIARASKIIKEQKANMIVDHIVYKPLDSESACYSSEIFTETKYKADTKTLPHSKHITDILVLDSRNEVKFAKELEEHQEVLVYAKLPKGFSIPTPVGRYSPDWAVVFQDGDIKHMYFVAETKGDLSSLELRPIESAKIKCTKRLFKDNIAKVKYQAVIDYQSLVALAKG